MCALPSDCNWHPVQTTLFFDLLKCVLPSRLEIRPRMVIFSSLALWYWRQNLHWPTTPWTQKWKLGVIDDFTFQIGNMNECRTTPLRINLHQMQPASARWSFISICKSSVSWPVNVDHPFYSVPWWWWVCMIKVTVCKHQADSQFYLWLDVWSGDV